MNIQILQINYFGVTRYMELIHITDLLQHAHMMMIHMILKTIIGILIAIRITEVEIPLTEMLL